MKAIISITIITVIAVILLIAVTTTIQNDVYAKPKYKEFYETASGEIINKDEFK